MSDSGPKALFVERLRDFAADTLKEPFDNLDDVRRSKLMARYFAECILGPRNPVLLPATEEELVACIVDGRGDQGVDLICREDGVVLIIQAKYSGGKKASKRPSEQQADIDHFRNILTRLRNYHELDISERLREIVAEIDWETDRFQLYYITLRQLSPSQEHTATWNVSPLASLPDLLDRTEFHLLGESKLNQELRDTLSLDATTRRVVELLFTANDDGPAWLKMETETGRTSYVGRLSGAQLAILFTNTKSALFNLNIRNYIGDTATNKNIKRTAVTQPSDFFFFNNGISALADDVQVVDGDERKLRCTNLSVVNGAQTVRSLHKAHTENPEAARMAQVLVRITEVPGKRTVERQEFLDNLTKFNNTQNAIKISDFRSNDKVQHDLRNRFNHLPSVGGRKFAYKSKRSGPAEKESRRGGDITIAMEEFTKTVYAFMFGPDDMFGGTGHVFDATTGGGYNKLYGQDGELLPSLSNERFETYAGIWFICADAKVLWQEESRSSKHPALERRWMFYFALGETLRCAYGQDSQQLTKELCRLSKPGWTAQSKEDRTKRSIARAAKLAFKAMREAYDEAKSKSGFTHRNWFRSQSTLQSLSERISNNWELVSEYAADYRLLGR